MILFFVFQIIVLWVLLHIQRFSNQTKKWEGGEGGAKGSSVIFA